MESEELPLTLFRGVPGETRTKVVVSAKLRRFFDDHTFKRGTHLLWKKTRKDDRAYYDGTEFSTRRLAWLVLRGTSIPDNCNVIADCTEEDCLVHLTQRPGGGRRVGSAKRAGDVPSGHSRRLLRSTVGTPLRPAAQPPPALRETSPTLQELAAQRTRPLVHAAASLRAIEEQRQAARPLLSELPVTVTEVAVKAAEEYNRQEDAMIWFIEQNSTPSNGSHAHVAVEAAPVVIPQPPAVDLLPNEAEQERMAQSIGDRVLHRLKQELQSVVREHVMSLKPDLWVELAGDLEALVKQTLATAIAGVAVPATPPPSTVQPTPAPPPARETHTYTVNEAVEHLAMTLGGDFLEDNNPLYRSLLIFNPRSSRFYVGKVSREKPHKCLGVMTREEFTAKRGGGFFSEFHIRRARERGLKHEYASRFVTV